MTSLSIVQSFGVKHNMNKELKHITELLDRYGLEQILEDNEITVEKCLQILDELGYVYLDMYDGPGMGC